MRTWKQFGCLLSAVKVTVTCVRMGTCVRMKDQEFEDEAALLLAEYGNKHGQVIAPPIPVDEMVELYLGLSLEFLDMQKLFGVSDVHGALWSMKRN